MRVWLRVSTGVILFPENGFRGEHMPLTADVRLIGLAATMGSSCGVGRGSRGRWRKPLRRSAHGKGLEGRGLEWRSDTG